MTVLTQRLQVQYNGSPRIAEVQYFFQAEVQGVTKAFALVSLYSPPDAPLLEKSSGALAVCNYKGQSNFKVIPTSSFRSVVAMVPYPAGGEDDFFLVEKLGLEMAHSCGHDEVLLPE